MKKVLLLLVLISSIFSVGEVVEIEKRDAFVGVSMEEMVDSYVESYPFIPSEFEISINLDDISVLDLFK